MASAECVELQWQWHFDLLGLAALTASELMDLYAWLMTHIRSKLGSVKWPV